MNTDGAARKGTCEQTGKMTLLTWKCGNSEVLSTLVYFCTHNPFEERKNAIIIKIEYVSHVI
tara:strand:+ start:362 stop:547 length:186 start_codon:yes stop_codon:yes gene_type:complete